MSVLLVDFEDSFTYNIASEIKSNITPSIKIIKWNQVESDDLTIAKIVCLGPGPGHPLDYKVLIDKILQSKDKINYLFGICLGHQILGLINGYQVVPCAKPVHGIKKNYYLPPVWEQKLKLSQKKITVQHYNSWCLKEEKAFINQAFSNNGEVLILDNKKYRGYQFHPESIATSNRKSFFYFLKDKL